MYNSLKPYTLAGLEPTNPSNRCCDGHHATPPEFFPTVFVRWNILGSNFYSFLLQLLTSVMHFRAIIYSRFDAPTSILSGAKNRSNLRQSLSQKVAPNNSPRSHDANSQN
jgi:hypothetical protein